MRMVHIIIKKGARLELLLFLMTNDYAKREAIAAASTS